MRKAYVTLITNEGYLPGALVLAQSLMCTHTNIPFYVFLPKSASDTIAPTLIKKGIQYIEFDWSPQSQAKGSGYWEDTLAKLTVFQTTEFDKIVFLDADMIVLQNIDSLFDRPHMSAVAAGKELHADWTALNSGLMVIEPNLDEYHGMLAIANDVYRTRTEAGLPFGDQDVINQFFSDWECKTELQLPSYYNVMLGYGGILKSKKIISNVTDIFVYHFTGREKPWGSFRDRLIILLKILRRSPHWFIDLSVCIAYFKLTKI